MRLAMNLSLAALGAALVLVSGTAHAEATQASFNPVLDKHEVNNFMYDSGLVPADSPLQIQLTAGIRDELSLNMPGNGEYEWDDGTITLIGDDGAGEIEYGIIADTEITVAIELFGQNFELNVIESVLGGQPLEIGIDASELYTPYLLNGNADAPTDLAQAIPIDIFDEPFSVGPFDGTIALSVELELFGVNYLSTMVDLQSEMGGPVDATVVDEGEVVDFALVEPGVDETTSAWGTVHGEVDIAATLTFIPSIEIQGLTLDEELAVDFPLNEGVALAFEPAQMDFAGPPEPPEPETTGSPEPETTEGPDSDTDGSSDGDPTVDPTTGTTGDASAGPETTGDPMGDTGTDSDGVEDEGCGCSADEGDRGAAGFALLGLALLGLRRRRR